jgi:hypothetical protein
VLPFPGKTEQAGEGAHYKSTKIVTKLLQNLIFFIHLMLLQIFFNKESLSKKSLF